MFDIGFGEMLVIAALALILIGPKQLPEVARTLGRLMNEFKRATGEFTKTFTDTRDSARSAFDDIQRSVTHTPPPTSELAADMAESASSDSPVLEQEPVEDQMAFHMNDYEDDSGIGSLSSNDPHAHSEEPTQGQFHFPLDPVTPKKDS
ncbi:MAG: twin-arginine translocase TatA/TatE family subunit [Proteobacteria bacterium]|nr:MAG: twin-arginine translocase TatA/TatE family subunit [Pseudomonadota bacterium]